tara:strand:+ start:28 stop:3060 length:3033 start_codon:yes stop_codon:yes gene_type:complete
MTSINIRKLSHSEMDLYRKPLLPERWSCFPVDKEIDTQSLRTILQKDLDKIRSGAEKDPFSNSINMLALDISRRLERDKLNYSALEALIQRLAVGSVGFKADRLKKYIGEVNIEKNNCLIQKLIKSIIFDEKKKKKSFKEFKKIIENDAFGIVLTAHPTFGMSKCMLEDIASMATMTDSDGKKIDLENVKKIIKKIFQTEQRPDHNISLDYEHELSIVSLKNLQLALNLFYKQVLEVSKQYYPDEYLNINPNFFNLHSWVGYDVDGRGDISWVNTYAKRLKLKIEQLKIYDSNLKTLKKKIGSELNILKNFNVIERKIISSLNVNNKVYIYLEKKDLINNIEELKNFSRFLITNDQKLLSQTKDILIDLERIIQLLNKSKIKNKNKIIDEFLLFKIQVKNYGLGLAKTQVRLNANQLNNAISKEINLKSDPNDPSNKSTYINLVSKLIDKVKPVNINFGNLVEENMNAKKYFMILAQMFKFIDKDQPIRFLIAECDYALTALTALYFAKLFNVDSKIDISPLFETEKGLRDGHNVIETLIKNSHYREYIKKRGRICIQTGFSDAGRYLGQTAAVLSIENLQRKVARVLSKNGLSNIKLLIFDTHGESIGRGGHPVSLSDRLEYVSCKYTRKKLKEWKIVLSQEISFQGGDGYQYFMNKELAYSAVARILEFCISNNEYTNDKLYDSEDFGVEFVNTIKQFNKNIMDDPNFATLLGIFGSNILHSTGYRAIKRQNDSGVKTLVYHPSQTRAIPQNSMLQQLGMLANSLGGIGQFIRKDYKRFTEYYNKSERFKRIMDIVKYSFAFSDIEVLKAYIDCFDPGMWLSWSTRTADQKRSENMKEVANLLESFDIHWRLNKVYRELHQEYMEIRNWLLGRKAKGRIAVGRGRVVEKEIRDELLLMHGIRVAIFHEIFLLSVQIPKFSDQAGVSRDEVIAKIIRFDTLDAVQILRKIFQIGKKDKSHLDYGEISNYQSEKNLNYKNENDLFKRLEALHECTRRVSTGINHFVGSVG